MAMEGRPMDAHWRNGGFVHADRARCTSAAGHGEEGRGRRRHEGWALDAGDTCARRPRGSLHRPRGDFRDDGDGRNSRSPLRRHTAHRGGHLLARPHPRRRRRRRALHGQQPDRHGVGWAKSLHCPSASELDARLPRQPRRRPRHRRDRLRVAPIRIRRRVGGAQALSIAAAKTNFGFVQAIALGALCNALVCLAVWLCYSARSAADKILAIVPPIAAFVAAGFEHSVANMYFVPVGLLVKTDDAFTATQQGLPDLSELTWGRFLVANLIPVTIGNIIGGAVMVGAMYWFVYLRNGRPPSEALPHEHTQGPFETGNSRRVSADGSRTRFARR